MTLDQSVLATLAYHDIFDYPLQSDEVHEYLIGNKTDLLRVSEILDKLVKSKKIGETKALYSLRGRNPIVNTRLSRQKYSTPKFKRGQFYANILKIIPTVKMIAISGALAMENSHKNDDIDLVIVTAKKTLWTTRFLASLLLLPFKRNRSGTKVSNRACLNLFIDQLNLKIQPQNLYSAHEICQMKPLWDREQTYSRFIEANSWTQKFLPNWKMENQWQMHSGQWKIITPHASLNLLSPIETILKKIQLNYMKSKITNERIGETQLFFHPQNTQERVLNEYEKRLRILKIFWKGLI